MHLICSGGEGEGRGGERSGPVRSVVCVILYFVMVAVVSYASAARWANRRAAVRWSRGGGGGGAETRGGSQVVCDDRCAAGGAG